MGDDGQRILTVDRKFINRTSWVSTISNQALQNFTWKGRFCTKCKARALLMNDVCDEPSSFPHSSLKPCHQLTASSGGCAFCRFNEALLQHFGDQAAVDISPFSTEVHWMGEEKAGCRLISPCRNCLAT